MQVENDYDKDVYNGDLGVVSSIDMEQGRNQRRFRRPRSYVRLRRTRRTGPRLRDDNPQEPGLGVPGCRHPIQYSALPNAGAELGLYGSNTRQAAGGARRPKEGAGNCRKGSTGTAAAVETR